MSKTSTSRAFYFTAVFWGREFSEYFINLLLASLLAPDNIPALQNKQDSKFVIATTKEDWSFIQSQPLFETLKTYIDVIYIDINVEGHTSKMLMMSHGHKLISDLLFTKKAIGVFVTPDLVLSNGSIIALEKQIASGKKVVLCAAIRFDYDGCMEGLQQLGFMVPNKPMNITSRDLMRVALKNLHSESKTWLWDEPYYAYNPVCSLWKAPGEANYILHGYSWAPLAVDYSAIQHHDTSTFEASTLDHDYIYKNFGITPDIYVVSDSDEIALVSFTKESDLSLPLIENPTQKVYLLSNSVKKDNLRQFHYNPIHGMDPLKQQLVLKTIYLHSDPINSECSSVVARAKSLVHKAIKTPPDKQEHLCELLAGLQNTLRHYKKLLRSDLEHYAINSTVTIRNIGYKCRDEPLPLKHNGVIFLRVLNNFYKSVSNKVILQRVMVFKIIRFSVRISANIFWRSVRCWRFFLYGRSESGQNGTLTVPAEIPIYVFFLAAYFLFMQSSFVNKITGMLEKFIGFSFRGRDREGQ